MTGELTFSYTIKQVIPNDLVRFSVRQGGATVGSRNHIVTYDDVAGNTGSITVTITAPFNPGASYTIVVEIEIQGQWVNLSAMPDKKQIDVNAITAIFFDGFQLGVR